MPELPSQVDRMIAFLHSHFGTVEFLSPEEANEQDEAREDALVAEEEEKKPKVGDESIKSEEVPPSIEATHLKNGSGAHSGPVIRVRLDDHFADVDVENLVSFRHLQVDSESRVPQAAWLNDSRDVTPVNYRVFTRITNPCSDVWSPSCMSLCAQSPPWRPSAAASPSGWQQARTARKEWLSSLPPDFFYTGTGSVHAPRLS